MVTMTQATIAIDQNEQTLNLNQNKADCLRSINNFGSSTVQNICNGKSTVVPWGSADWVLALGLITFFGLLGLMLLAFAIMLLREVAR